MSDKPHTYLRPSDCPEFFKMVDEAKGKDLTCIMHIAGYQTIDEAYLLMQQLWLAHDSGIAILFAPKPND